MKTLKVPEGGLELAGSCSPDTAPLPQAFVVNLSDDVVQQMIQAARLGDDIDLQLGKNPALHYGSHTHRISRPEEGVAFDLFLTKPYESTRRAERLPHASSVFAKPKSISKKSLQPVHATEPKKKPAATNKSSTSSGLDSDIEALQNGLAAHSAARDRARVIEKLPLTKPGRGKLLSGYASSPKSMPTSPALNATRSPNLTPQITASQQLIERKKEQRFTLVHELAVEDRSTDYLKEKWTGKEEDFRPTLEKIAELKNDSPRWSLKQHMWKELDVWKYDYDSQSNRQKAIDGAIRQYDKQRLSPSEQQWQLLLPKEERNKGKCLSRLQASIAKGPAQSAPIIKVQKAEDSSGSRETVDSPRSEKSKAGGEPMSRSNSNSLPVKAKKAADVSKTKAAAAAPQKASPKKPKPTSKNDRRILSAEIIHNSDSSEDDAPPKATKTEPAPPKARDTVIVNTRPSAPAREPVKKPPVKRPRDDSDSSSSSGTPLIKRIKPKQPLPAPKPRPQMVKATHQGQSRAAPPSARRKHPSNTSPTKSSPLASSPPTNASDLDEPPPPPPPPRVPLKRKMDAEARPAAVKRRAVQSVPDEVMDKAHKFKVAYREYEALHFEIADLDNPPHHKVDDLMKMRGRLQRLKMEIYKQCSPSRD